MFSLKKPSGSHRRVKDGRWKTFQWLLRNDSVLFSWRNVIFVFFVFFVVAYSAMDLFIDKFPVTLCSDGKKCSWMVWQEFSMDTKWEPDPLIPLERLLIRKQRIFFNNDQVEHGGRDMKMDWSKLLAIDQWISYRERKLLQRSNCLCLYCRILGSAVVFCPTQMGFQKEAHVVKL